jgi:hypothetical protein
MAKIGLSTQRFSFQCERYPAAKKIGGCCLLGHTPVEIPGHVPEGASQGVLRDNTPSDLIGDQDEIADRMIQVIEKGVDLHPDLFFSVVEMMIEIPQPHRETIDDNNFRAARKSSEHPGKLNGFLDRMKLIASFYAVPGDPLFHLLIKGNRCGDESPLRIVSEAKRKSE